MAKSPKPYLFRIENQFETKALSKTVSKSDSDAIAKNMASRTARIESV